MTPVYKLSASSIKGRTNYGSMLAGNTAFVPRYFESIATVSVGSGGAATIDFTSIPATYTHLQARWLIRSTATGGDNASELRMKINSSSGTYRSHGLVGTGSSAQSGDYATSTGSWVYYAIPNSSVTASVFGGGVIDILDYANTSKNTVSRMLGGWDANGSGQISLQSHLWVDTSAVTELNFTLATGNFAQYSHFALYGIKGA